MRHVIIGAGIAGVSAAQSIKKIDAHAEVILIGEERYFPYNRYLLTDFLCESISNESIFYTSAQYFDEKGIKLRKGEYVKAIDPDKKSVKFFHNEVMNYDKLLITTGGCPVLGPVLRRYGDNIQRYYSLKDILLIKRKLSKIRKCVVYGSGLSTLDMIRGMHNLGIKVTYIVHGPKAEFPIIESDFTAELHDFLISKGIEIITDDRIITVNRVGEHYRVLTINKREFITDIVFAWDYYLPNINCIEGTKIEKKIGILVDQQLRTSVDDIYAAGDCVEIYHPGIKDYWINFGWTNASEQGEIAGKSMAGMNEKYQIHDTIIFNLMGKPLRARWWE